MASLAQTLRNLTLSKNQRVLRKANILDECGVHTREGRNLLWVVLFQEYEAKLVAAVKTAQADQAADGSDEE